MNLSVKTSTKTELVDITSKIAKWVKESGVSEGLCMLYVPHTTAAVTINESADPSVRGDIMMVLNQIIPWDANYKHLEGNSPAHIMASLMGSSLTIAVDSSSFVLGTWQKIFFCEFDGPRTRKVHYHFLTNL